LRFALRRRAPKKLVAGIEGKIEEKVGNVSHFPTGRGKKGGDRAIARGTGVSPATIRNDNKLKKLAEEYPCTAPN
jgi:hypothetical protein